jgi:hypothetical protein
MPVAPRVRFVFIVALLVLASCFSAFAQMETATLSGVVTDPKGGVVPEVEVMATRIETGRALTTKTNGAGIYVFTSLMPGHYHLEVAKPGFKSIAIKDVELHVEDKLERNFSLEIGSVSETVTVTANENSINTTDATVSTVVDRNFAENLPLNGRSFQTLIQLTPGVVLTTSSAASDGQFSVNGQRANSNYWMVDGVSANIGMSSNSFAADTLSGSLGGFSAQGGTNSLVSVDAMQEFRIQTSTFAPEFGRTPGGQISIVTRSGTNQFHGTLFDYVRNDVLDANNWFNDYYQLPKADESQNDFGGVLGGPIIKDRTFFFLSYEALRLQLPQTALSTVPDLNARQTAIPAMQPFFNAYPLPNGPEILNPDGTPTGTAPFNISYSNRSTLDAASLRVDHKVNDKLTLFGRYNYAPSELVERPGSDAGDALSVVQTIRISTQTATAGATWVFSPSLTNDLRANYSRVNSTNVSGLDAFGGAAPFVNSDVNFPSPFSLQNSLVFVGSFFLTNGYLDSGGSGNLFRQLNLVDSVSLLKGSHSLKFGADYRRLTPVVAPVGYIQSAYFFDLAAAQSGQTAFAIVESQGRVPLILQNLGLFAQDTWRVGPRLTVTYGLRWDVDFAPKTSSGPSLPAVLNSNDPSTLALAPPGTPVFSTKYGNLAPRLGVAYQILQKAGWERVLRGGWGIFYDLPTAQLGVASDTYPFGATSVAYGAPFPLDAATAAPPVISAANPNIYGVDPELKSPYTQEWNLALQQSLGAAQSLSISYVGAVGRHLLLTESISQPNPNVASATLVNNYGTSDFGALQLQFQRRLSRGLQVLASYQWGHSIDTGSTGSGGTNSSDYYQPQLGANVNRGPSDFDIRNSASVALTYNIPGPKVNAFANSVLGHWSTENVFQARSAPPVDVNYYDNYIIGGATVDIRPDVEPGIPLYLYGSQYPGGKAFNNAPGAVIGGCSDGSQSIGPFCPPPINPSTGDPTRQGDLGRNALRGFGAWQWDFAVHRDFPIHESMKLQFRAEIFNLLNHPNFAQPSGILTSPSFGLSNQTLGQSLDYVNQGSGSFNPLYQFGGPRSVQLALKMTF